MQYELCGEYIRLPKGWLYVGITIFSYTYWSKPVYNIHITAHKYRWRIWANYNIGLIFSLSNARPKIGGYELWNKIISTLPDMISHIPSKSNITIWSGDYIKYKIYKRFVKRYESKFKYVSFDDEEQTIDLMNH